MTNEIRAVISGLKLKDSSNRQTHQGLGACLKSGLRARFHKLGEHDLAGGDVNGGLGMLVFSFIILS